jgi:ribosomal protein L11 methyltransferase
MTPTIELTLYLDESLQEYAVAELSDLDFDTFLQEEGCLKAYVPASQWDGVKREHVERWMAANAPDADLEERVVEPENWNRKWEETIQPIAVGPFLVKPTWAGVPPGDADKILLEIDPKMSFGTGYHESTRLALRFLPETVRAGDVVLDVGTGTGILAIAAVKLGAGSAIAFDIDEWAQENAVENLYLNEVENRITFREGGLEVVPEAGFDLILANIQLNVLLGMAPDFAEKLRPGGRLVLAGLLREQRERMLEGVAAYGFELVREDTEGAWWAGVCRLGSTGDG